MCRGRMGKHTLCSFPDPSPSLGLPRQAGAQMVPDQQPEQAGHAQLPHNILTLSPHAHAWEQREDEEGPLRSGSTSPFTSIVTPTPSPS